MQKQIMYHFLAPAGQPKMMYKTSMHFLFLCMTNERMKRMEVYYAIY